MSSSLKAGAVRSGPICTCPSLSLKNFAFFPSFLPQFETSPTNGKPEDKEESPRTLCYVPFFIDPNYCYRDTFTINFFFNIKNPKTIPIEIHLS